METWQTRADVVEKQSARRSEFNYREDQIPAYTLPEPLVDAEGQRIESKAAWSRRRQEILELFRTHVYGRAPGRPDNLRAVLVKEDPGAMDGQATLKRVDLHVGDAPDHPVLHLRLFVPNAVGKPAPAFLLLCNRSEDNIDPTRETRSGFWPAEEIVARGYCAAAFPLADVDPDRHDGFRNGVHGVYDRPEERTGDSWGTLAAWAWGASRVMDIFERDPDVDDSFVAVVGHSRGGKTALWAGAEDDRFALTISNESGCGGAALSRRCYGETVARINRTFPHWFCENFRQYGDREGELPVDQHMLLSLIAPRAVYVASADTDLWSDPRGEWLALLHAEPVYRLLGSEGLGRQVMPPLDTPVHGDRMAYHIRTGGHNLTPYDWQRFMDFADRLRQSH